MLLKNLPVSVRVDLTQAATSKKKNPVSVRDFCLHHSTGENFAAYRTAARRWEEQQRLFQDSQIGLGKTLDPRLNSSGHLKFMRLNGIRFMMVMIGTHGGLVQ